MRRIESRGARLGRDGRDLTIEVAGVGQIGEADAVLGGEHPGEPAAGPIVGEAGGSAIAIGDGGGLAAGGIGGTGDEVGGLAGRGGEIIVEAEQTPRRMRVAA